MSSVTPFRRIFRLTTPLQTSFRVWEGFLIQITNTDSIQPSPTISEISPQMVVQADNSLRPFPAPIFFSVSNPDGRSAVLKNGFTFLAFPRIDTVTVVGKELAVFGREIDKGAVILVGGSPQKTRQDISGGITNPFLLIKAARMIAPGQTVLVQVRNANGLVSAPVSYTRPGS